MVEYDVTVIEQDDGTSVAERASMDAVELADVQVKVDGTFLGAGSILTLPSDDGDGNITWRARLLYDWRIYCDGTIARRGGVVHDPFESRWTLTLIDDAARYFKDQLDAFPLRSGLGPNPALDLSGVDFLVRATDRIGRIYPAYWYDVQLLWDEVTSQFIDITFPSTTLFQYTTQYYDSGASLQTITRTAKLGLTTLEQDLQNYDATNIRGAGAMPANLPDISAGALFDALQVMEGWRLRVAYETFPLRSVVVTLYSDPGTVSSGGTAIDDLIEADHRPILDIE
jgi:hypothetical protein